MGRRGLRVWVDGDPSSELMVGFAARDLMCRSKAPPFRTDLGPPHVVMKTHISLFICGEHSNID